MEYKVEKNIQYKQQNEKRLKNDEDSLEEHWDNIKCNHICIIRILEGEEKEQGIENLFEKIMTENFPNLVKEKVMQVQEAQRVPVQRNPKRPTPRHVTIKIAKLKEKES